MWVETEVAGALSMKQRLGTLTAEQRTTAFRTWRKLLTDWRLLPVEARHFTSAGELTGRGLRSGDALHLAMAVDAQAGLATRDQQLAQVAEALGLAVYRPA